MKNSAFATLLVLAISSLPVAAGDYYAAAQPSTYGGLSQSTLGGGLSPTATPFRYSYLEGGWMQLNPKGDPMFDGYWVGASYSPTDNFFLWGQWQHHSWEILDLSLLQGGIGFYVPITERVDWVTRLGYGKFAAGALGYKASVTGYTGYTGFRIGLNDRIEAQLGLDATYIDSDLSIGGAGALLVGLTEKVKLMARTTYFADQIDYGAGVRFEFQ
jgi:hypothetical protein